MRWRDFADLPSLSAEFFDHTRRVHFIGIGGIGMSALARVLASRGHKISGSDVSDGPHIKELRDHGMVVAIGHSAENLDLMGAPAEAIIFSSAVTPDNPERKAAAERGTPQFHRAQLLAYFVNTAKHSIAVSGTHGKSTTSAMVAHILTECGYNPTAILGAVYPPFGSNARIGDPDLVVVEADESDGSFTLLHPTVSVILNVEPEHLENYDDSEERLWEAFGLFAQQAREKVVLNVDDVGLRQRFLTTKSGEWYSIALPQIAPRFTQRVLEATNIFQRRGETRYDIFGELADNHAGPFRLIVAGTHNVSNGLAAITTVQSAGVPVEQAAKALESFRGIGRRFELKGEAGGVLVYDDYGHHPTEVEKTLEAARGFLGRRLGVIFQPHRYSRVAQLAAQFGPAFAAADYVIITQLYSAFEEPIPGVSGKNVYDSVVAAFPDKPVFYAQTLDEAKDLALRYVQPGDALFTMGAGNITHLGPQLLSAINDR